MSEEFTVAGSIVSSALSTLMDYQIASAGASAENAADVNCG